MRVELPTLFQLALGLSLLLGGGELLVRGASRLAAAFRVPPLVIGLTVVAFGTSSPELAVSVGAAFGGRPDLALGNVVGSNVFNVLFILGAAALIAPLKVSTKLVRLDVPLLIGASVLFYALVLDGRLGRLDGTVLVSCGIAYTAFQIRSGRREAASRPAPTADRRWVLAIAAALLGLACLTAGSHQLVAAAVELARRLGVGELVIGLTIVAVGTSLPEIATSLVAAWRGERDIAVGNVVGSNIFNLAWVLGLAAAVSPSGLTISQAALSFDLPVMLAVAVACLPIFFTGYTIARWEGALFLAYYAAYTVFLLLAAQRHAAVGAAGAVMLRFVLPLTAATLAVLAARALRRHRRGRRGGGG